MPLEEIRATPAREGQKTAEFHNKPPTSAPVSLQPRPPTITPSPTKDACPALPCIFNPNLGSLGNVNQELSCFEPGRSLRARDTMGFKVYFCWWSQENIQKITPEKPKIQESPSKLFKRQPSIIHNFKAPWLEVSVFKGVRACQGTNPWRNVIAGKEKKSR